MMKQLLLLPALFLNFASLHAGTESSGGGVTFPVETSQFIDANFLAKTAQQAVALVLQSQLPEAVKQDFKQDLEFTTKYHTEYIKMVPAVFSVGFARHEGDYQRLMGHCSFTSKLEDEYSSIDQTIYISSARAECYSTRLVEVLIHETFHHVLSKYLNFNEEFMDRLTAELVAGRSSTYIYRMFKTNELLPKAIEQARKHVHANNIDFNISLDCLEEGRGDGNPFDSVDSQDTQDDYTFYFPSSGTGCDFHHSVWVKFDYTGNFITADFIDA